VTSTLRLSLYSGVCILGKEKGRFCPGGATERSNSCCCSPSAPVETGDGAVLTGSQRSGVAEEAADCVRKRRG